MSRPDSPPSQASHRSTVDAHFAAQTSLWHELYRREDLHAVIHQQRRIRALDWIRRLGVPEGARVLEVGCGAGLMAIELLQQGYRVTATDAVPEMLDLTRRNAAAVGIAERLDSQPADVQNLRFDDQTFDVVVALGVLPWVEDPARAVREMSRVLKSGGHVVATGDNNARLTYFADPMRNPALAGLRRNIKRMARAAGLIEQRPMPGQFWPRQFDALFASAGLWAVHRATVGFGVFSLFGAPILPNAVGLRVHHRLQRLADRRVRILRSAGAQHFLVARRPPPQLRDLEPRRPPST
jgi:ubiquinone/menaquinone biosynthesis C-methylase UbiE